MSILVVAFIMSYNSISLKEQAVTAQWVSVETAYYRRSDLIPNLVNTIREAGGDESAINGVMDARAKVMNVNIDAENPTPEAIKQYQRAEDGLTDALVRLLVSIDENRALIGNQHFAELQAQLEGTENRINTERRKFNEVATEYNSALRQFPGALYASKSIFKPKGVFIDEPPKKAPKIDFGK